MGISEIVKGVVVTHIYLLSGIWKQTSRIATVPIEGPQLLKWYACGTGSGEEELALCNRQLGQEFMQVLWGETVDVGIELAPVA